MPKELKALLRRGQKVRDHLDRLSDEAAKISAQADKVLTRPECPVCGGSSHAQPCHELRKARTAAA